MLKTFIPTPSQQSSIIRIVTEDINRRPFGRPVAVPANFGASMELIVHASIRGPIDQYIFQAIPASPVVPLPGGGMTLAEGAMAVGSALAASLGQAITANQQMRLLVPHAYAVPKEVDALQGRYGGNAVIFSDNVYVAFSAGHADPVIIRRALARMIGGYSVAWLFDDNGSLVRPVAAVVRIFDGDGFALIGRLAAASSTPLPDIPYPISN
jgi:hypothetical protein